jgi:ABC-2 type transport system permease protein
VLAFSLTGFTLPVQAMPTYIQSFAMAFPLRHYYLFYVQEAIFASGFAGWWKEVIHLLVFLVLPPLSMWRLADAYRHQNYITE